MLTLYLLARVYGIRSSGTDAVCQRAGAGGEFAFVFFYRLFSACRQGDQMVIGDRHIITI